MANKLVNKSKVAVSLNESDCWLVQEFKYCFMHWRELFYILPIKTRICSVILNNWDIWFVDFKHADRGPQVWHESNDNQRQLICLQTQNAVQLTAVLTLSCDYSNCCTDKHNLIKNRWFFSFSLFCFRAFILT